MRIPLAAPLLAVVLATGCALPERTVTADEAPAETTASEPPYAAYARRRERRFQEQLEALFVRAQERIAVVRATVREAYGEPEVPEFFATREDGLRHLRDPRILAYETRIQEVYDWGREALVEIHDATWDAAAEMAREVAPSRAPLDSGVTGDPLLDRQLDAFAETLRAAVDLPQAEVELYQTVQRRVELFEAFTTFGIEGADQRLGGRLMLFVGGDEFAARPRANVVLRVAEEVPLADRGLAQAVRIRAMRGDTIVDDLGWRLTPEGTGRPPVEEHPPYLIAPDVALHIRSGDPAFAELHDMRIVADVQSGVFDRAGTILGGVNWRVEYRITMRGDVSWQLAGGRPRFDESCDELAATLEREGVALGG